MKNVIVVAALLAASATSLADESPDGFRPLFNGTNLDGWVLVNTPPQTWSVEDGMLKCTGRPIGEIRTEKMYQNFVLELEWRHMVPRGNAGVFIWADDITARGVPFHRGIEVQVLENAYGQSQHHTTHGDIFPIHGATMTPDNGRGGSRAFPTEERSKPSPEWNHYRITGIDGTLKLEVNGRQVTSGRDCSPRKGYICLESEGGVVDYRNIRIRELPGGDVPAEHVAIANRGYRSIYTGLDLSGWKTDDADHWKSSDWVLSFDGTEGGPGSTLSTTAEYRDFGFVVDVRLKKPDSEAVLWLRDNDDGAVQISLTDQKSVREHLQEAGQWNRLEGSIAGDHLTLTVNGHDVDCGEISVPPTASGSLSLSAFGPTEFANIYVRELPGKP
ncbi:MAG: family 16 glycoside hydrolase [Planctomycetaceae bacterium]